MQSSGTLNRRGLLSAFRSPAPSLQGARSASLLWKPGRRYVPIRARTDRIIDIAVCLRPFRAAGPRIETEALWATAGHP